jgi:hypothetical protein
MEIDLAVGGVGGEIGGNVVDAQTHCGLLFRENCLGLQIGPGLFRNEVQERVPRRSRRK